MENMKTTKLEATKSNVEHAIGLIEQYAKDKGYQIVGEFKKEGFLSKLLNQKLTFESKGQEKVLRNYLTRLEKKVCMSTANKFLHFLYKKVYKSETAAPRVEYSEQELKIKAARKAWRITLAESKRLELAYKETKGNFYKA
jgi:hypothetical protein